jgi:formiminotetrahydrofolate cyclodeaminase
VVAAAAALVQKVATLSGKHWAEAGAVHDRAELIRLRSEELVEEDSLAYLDFVAARRSGQGVDAAQARTVDVPLEIARNAAEVAAMARELMGKGNPNLGADASVAWILAGAAAESAALLVIVNVGAGLRDTRVTEVRRLAREASAPARSPAAPGRSGARDRGRARSADSDRS